MLKFASTELKDRLSRQFQALCGVEVAEFCVCFFEKTTGFEKEFPL